ncbi:MAG: hypothetical protein JWM93_490 [Frankiales bacterium]|nr:hypothetical protein [Frankiales bacterium]
MAVPVLTAVGDPAVEGALVAAFDRPTHGITVVRRCVDVADLVAAATLGTARCAIISSDLRRLDRDVIARLAAAGVAVVALVPGGDEGAERWVRQLGAEHVLPASATPAEVAGAVLAASGDADPGATSLAYADPLSVLPQRATPTADHSGFEALSADGRVIAVWGPTGAPGRSTVALTLADELARLDVATLLVDADAYGGALAQALGMLEESPGIAAACRMANTGTLDVPALSRLARALSPRLRVLTGITRADRWPELRPSAIEHVLQLSRRLVSCTVVDCGFSLEQDEELAYDTMAPRRNGATLTALAEADLVVAVVAADPIGIQRFIRALPELREASPAELAVVVNKVRGVVVPGDATAEIAAALQRYAGITAAEFIPYDRSGCDRALAGGQPLAAAAASSPARAAVARLARSLVAAQGPTAGGRGSGRTAPAGSGTRKKSRKATRAESPR